MLVATHAPGHSPIHILLVHLYPSQHTLHPSSWKAPPAAETTETMVTSNYWFCHRSPHIPEHHHDPYISYHPPRLPSTIEMTDLILNYVFRYFGIMKDIVTGDLSWPHLMGRFYGETRHLNEPHVRLSPQSNSKVERANKMVLVIILQF